MYIVSAFVLAVCGISYKFVKDIKDNERKEGAEIYQEAKMLKS